jgi:acyl-coenzyme A synthetase/AMP-(fatty) acid ligase
LRGDACANPGWFDTGDLAVQDEKGYYKWLGRSDDMIRSREVMINPNTIEKLLLENIVGLKECAIFGKNSLNCMYVGDCTNKSIQKFLLSLGPHCKAAKIIKVDSIPLNGIKVSRNFLNQLINS